MSAHLVCRRCDAPILDPLKDVCPVCDEHALAEADALAAREAVGAAWDELEPRS